MGDALYVDNWSSVLRSAITAVGLALALAGAVAGSEPALGGLSSAPRWLVFATHVPDLVAVDARSSVDVWAVGDGIVHWDGRTLRTTPLPWKHATLTGVSEVSPRDVWAVGNITTGSGATYRVFPLAAHWDGRGWSRQTLPPIGGSYVWLTDVVATAANQVWAVGGWGGSTTWPLMLNWDGSHWHRINLLRLAPTVGMLNTVDARGIDDVWAAGMDGNTMNISFGYADYVIHWNGHTWSRVSSPLGQEVGSGPYAGALDVGLNGDIWTVNFDQSGNGPFFVRWASRTKVAHASGWLTYQSYADIAAISTRNVWIVGRRDFTDEGPLDGTGPLIAHWDGTHWRVQHTPFEQYTHVGLNGIRAISANDIWAVGNHLIVRYAP